MTMYLRAKTNGIINEYHEMLAAHPDWEVVTEQQAFPEKFAPVDIKARDKKVDLTVPAEVAITPLAAPAELSAQKGRTFSNVGEVTPAKPITKAPSVDVKGLKGEF